MTLLFALSAHAATQCMTVDAFNAWMQTHEASADVTLSYDVTGVNPDDFWGTKGALADLTDTGCAAGGSLALKVYGPDDPPNTAHPAGTLKQEYGYNCGPMPNEEHWADPNASAEIFVDGTERCDVTIWIDPATFGYRLECDHGTFVGEADNGPAMPVDQITLFALTGGSTWRIDSAVSTWNEVCFEASEPVEDTGGDDEVRDVVEAIEDVTVATNFPTTVYSDPNDLCVEAGYSEVYLKFDLSAIPGRITSAALEIHADSDGSARGSGAEVWAVGDTSWDEDTLAWNARPGGTGSVLDRAGPISPEEAYTLDVSAAVSAPRVYAFALIPAASDTDGAHFRSVERGEGPSLRVTWVAEDVPPEDTDDGGGDTDVAGDTDDGSDSGIYNDYEDRPRREPDGKLDGGSGCGCGGASMPVAPWSLVALLALRRRAGLKVR